MNDDRLRLHMQNLPDALVCAAASVVPFPQIEPALGLFDGPRPTHEGDVVLLEVAPRTGGCEPTVQDATGRPRAQFPSDRIVGVLGLRQSTMHVLGSLPTTLLSRGSRLDLLSEGGVVGVAGEAPVLAARPVVLNLLGFVTYCGEPVNVSHWGAKRATSRSLPPLILVGGTATGVGKTTLACRIIHLLARGRGQRVGSIMLSGAGGKADMLAHRSAGASSAHSFIEAGLCNSYGCAPERFVSLVENLLFHIAEHDRPTVLVGELGGDLVWGNNEAVLRTACFMRDVRSFFLVCQDALAALGATRLLGDWGVTVPLRHVVSWRQNHAAMALRYQHVLQQELVDPGDELALEAILHEDLCRDVREVHGEHHA